MPHLDRRAVLAGLASLAAAPALGQAVPFGSVDVDVRRLRKAGAGPVAELLRQVMVEEARTALADRIAPGGPRLVVVLTSIQMTSYVGDGSSQRSGVGGGSDYLDGEALIVGPRGEVLRRVPQLFTQPANTGGAWFDPESERRRVIALGRNYIGWLRRTLA